MANNDLDKKKEPTPDGDVEERDKDSPPTGADRDLIDKTEDGAEDEEDDEPEDDEAEDGAEPEEDDEAEDAEDDEAAEAEDAEDAEDDEAEDDEAEDADADADAEDDDEEDGPLDLESRILCSDGNCIGVIGPNGRCKECGKPMDPADRPLLAKQSAESVADPGEAPAPVDQPPGPAAEAAAAPPATDDDAPGGDDLSGRRLCSDGNCIGVIGPNGRCKECGKPYTGEPE